MRKIIEFHLILLATLALATLSTAFARDLWTDNEIATEPTKVKLSSALKSTFLGSMPSADSALANEATGSGSLRLRLAPSYRTSHWTFESAYDNRLSYTPSSSLASRFATPPYASAPFRFWQLGGSIENNDWIEAQELDRASLSYSAKNLNLTLGRQGIGWGRGKIFSAVDIFAPFTPLQVDQEWRRGIDALRAELTLTETSSLEMISTGGPNWSQTAQGGRIRGYLGSIDGEILFAKRAQDFLYGITTSAAVWDAEVHAEFALFQTPGDIPLQGIGGHSSLIPKVVLGISNNFQVGSGLPISIEYHFSGFGATSGSGISSLLANPDYQSRLLRGDTQILGNQALGIQTSYIFNDHWNSSLALLQSLIDFSAVIAPSVIWDVSDSSSLLSTFFIAYGAASQNGIYQSQFGGVTPTLIVQFRIYD